jgi:uncharacterized protein YkwD
MMMQRFWGLLIGLLILTGTLIAATTTTIATANSNVLSDVSINDRYAEAILTLHQAGIISGHKDGTFKTGEKLRRAELTKLLLEADGIEIKNHATPCFDDVKDQAQWYFDPICTAKTLDIARGYEDNTFDPTGYVNRAEAINLLCRVHKWQTAATTTTAATTKTTTTTAATTKTTTTTAATTKTTTTTATTAAATASSRFSDAPQQEWYTACVVYAEKNELLDGLIPRSSQRFFPETSVSRGAFVDILHRSLLARGEKFEKITVINTPTIGTTSEPPGATLGPMISDMLMRVNQERTSRGLSVLIFSEELAIVAETHSIDMANRDFFDHINPDGDGPENRRIAAGISTGVGENLAKAPTIEVAHTSLMNSPPHKENILTPRWERMGIGISEHQDGSLLVTQLFAENPTTTSDLDNAKLEILSKVNQLRANKGLEPIFENNTLDTLAFQWSTRMRQESFFSVEAPGGEKLSRIVRDAVTPRTFQLLIYESNNLNIFVDLLIENPNAYIDEEFDTIGIGFALDEKGSISLTVILAD